MSSSPRPRRVARFVAAVAGICAGLFYIVFPPQTTTNFLDSSWPAQAWGAFLFAGGALCAVAYTTRILVIDRLGLSFLITGTVSLLCAQTMVMLQQPITYTRGGGTVILAVLIGFLVARWQDVRHDEQEAQVAIEATEQLGEGGSGERT